MKTRTIIFLVIAGLLLEFSSCKEPAVNVVKPRTDLVAYSRAEVCMVGSDAIYTLVAKTLSLCSDSLPNQCDSTYNRSASVVIKTDLRGNILWEKPVLKHLIYINFSGIKGIALPDGGFVLVGYFQKKDTKKDNNTYNVIKFDSTGKNTWLTAFVQRKFISVGQIALTKDGSMLMIGSEQFIDQDASNDGFITRINTDGTVRWKTYNPPLQIGNQFRVNSIGITELANGDILFADSYNKGRLVRLTADGKPIAEIRSDNILSFNQTANGYVTSNLNSTQSSQTINIFDNNDKLLRSFVSQQAGFNTEINVQLDNSLLVYTIGFYPDKNSYLRKYNALGRLEWERVMPQGLFNFLPNGEALTLINITREPQKYNASDIEMLRLRGQSEQIFRQIIARSKLD